MIVSELSPIRITVESDVEHASRSRRHRCRDARDVEANACRKICLEVELLSLSGRCRESDHISVGALCESSHYRSHCRIGNIGNQSPIEVWSESEVMSEVRSLSKSVTIESGIAVGVAIAIESNHNLSESDHIPQSESNESSIPEMSHCHYQNLTSQRHISAIESLSSRIHRNRIVSESESLSESVARSPAIESNRCRSQSGSRRESGTVDLNLIESIALIMSSLKVTITIEIRIHCLVESCLNQVLSESLSEVGITVRPKSLSVSIESEVAVENLKSLVLSKMHCLKSCH